MHGVPKPRDEIHLNTDGQELCALLDRRAGQRVRIRGAIQCVVGDTVLEPEIAAEQVTRLSNH